MMSLESDGGEQGAFPAENERNPLGNAANPFPPTLSRAGWKMEAGYRSMAGNHVRARANSKHFGIGQSVGGRYEVAKIYRGDLGVVYGAYDRHERIPVALKSPIERFFANSSARDPVLERAHTWVALDKHPSVVAAHSLEILDGRPYIIMQHVPLNNDIGGNLRDWLGKRPLTLEVAVRFSLQIAQAMQHMSSKMPGVAHGDLNPANVLVDHQGHAKITNLDLDIVHAADSGTPAYLAPELWRGETAEPGADIYAFGCILFEMFTGHSAFAACTLSQWKSSHLRDTPVSPRRIKPEMSAAMESLILACLAKKRSHRPESWDDVVLHCAREYELAQGRPAELDLTDYKYLPEDLENTCRSLAHLGKKTELLELCDREIALDPENPTAWNNRGIAYALSERHEEALASFDAALAIRPEDSNVLGNIGCVYASIHLSREALAAFDAALITDPESPRIWKLKGDAHFDLALDGFDDRYVSEEGMAAYEKALEINPEYAPAWCGKGLALLDMRRLGDALAAFDEAIAINPDFTEALEGKENALSIIKREEKEMASYHRADESSAFPIGEDRTSNSEIGFDNGDPDLVPIETGRSPRGFKNFWRPRIYWAGILLFIGFIVFALSRGS